MRTEWSLSRSGPASLITQSFAPRRWAGCLWQFGSTTRPAASRSMRGAGRRAARRYYDDMPDEEFDEHVGLSQSGDRSAIEESNRP